MEWFIAANRSQRHSLTHSLTHSLPHTLIHILTHTCTHTHTLRPSLPPSLLHSFTHSLTSGALHSSSWVDDWHRRSARGRNELAIDEIGKRHDWMSEWVMTDWQNNEPQLTRSLTHSNTHTNKQQRLLLASIVWLDGFFMCATPLLKNSQSLTLTFSLI